MEKNEDKEVNIIVDTDNENVPVGQLKWDI